MSNTVLYLQVLYLISLPVQNTIGDIGREIYYDLPKFWTNTGLCPAGKLTHDDIKASLFSEAMQTNLLLISSLPNGAITHIRIHWMLELLRFIQFNQSGHVHYDFDVLDRFMDNLDEIRLIPVIEFMANLSNVFTKNPAYNYFLWEDLSYQVVKRYQNYFEYVFALRRGLDKVRQNPRFALRGPAGLFKNPENHPLCWTLLQLCDTNISMCPIDIITYHRKGINENAGQLIEASKNLWSNIYIKFPTLIQLPISNDEADPISGWSTAREFQADVRYAVTLVNITLQHWEAIIEKKELRNLETISHDNAFLSYYPNVFTQRTLLAHFRINNTMPAHSQFVQKPVYAAIGMLSRLAELSAKVEFITCSENYSVKLLKTMSLNAGKPFYINWLLLYTDNEYISGQCIINMEIPSNSRDMYAYITETLDQNQTNPYNVWQSFGSPAYPNAFERRTMRLHQSPSLLSSGLLETNKIRIDLQNLKPPWMLTLRVCSYYIVRVAQPTDVLVSRVTHNEVLITWKDSNNESKYCLKSYQIWHRSNSTQEWIHITRGTHLPFPSYQYAPEQNEPTVNGE
uniref:Glycosyl hydrolases family 39 N-terminal catalytic domain-containing protein n=1 Tax=Glossina brevipalpis TaxID=37001 RepID=A0A1A9WBI0_9MUSC